MSLVREDVRPLLELLRHEIAAMQLGSVERNFPLAEVSLEGNTRLEPEYHGAIMHGLRQLAVAPKWPGPHGPPPRLEGQAASRAGAYGSGAALEGLAQSQGSQGGTSSSKSLPPRVRKLSQGAEGEGQELERNALSEGDIDAEAEQEPEFVDHRLRQNMKHQFQEELEALATRLDVPLNQVPFYPRPRTPQPAAQRLEGGAFATGHWAAAVTSSGSNIPDRSMEHGFGPPVAGDYQASHLDATDSDSDGQQHLSVNGQAAEARQGDRRTAASRGSSSQQQASESSRAALTSGAHPGGGDFVATLRGVQSEDERPNFHERLDNLSERLRESGLQVAGPDVLRYALDQVNSDVSLLAAEHAEDELDGAAQQQQQMAELLQNTEGGASQAETEQSEAEVSSRNMARAHSC